MLNFHNNNEKSGLICFSQKIKSPISIKFHDNDLLSLIIGKFATTKKDIQIINNTKFLNPNLTAAEANLNNNCNIFIFYYYKIIFRIYGMKNDCCPIRIFPNHDNMKISELIDDYLMKIGMTRSDIQNFQYKSKILDENKTIKEEGLEDNSDIFVLTNKQLDTISVFIKSDDENSMEFYNPIKIECLKSEKIFNLAQRVKYKLMKFDTNINLIFNSKELDNDLTVKEAKLSNDAILFIKYLYKL